MEVLREAHRINQQATVPLLDQAVRGVHADKLWHAKVALSVEVEQQVDGGESNSHSVLLGNDNGLAKHVDCVLIEEACGHERLLVELLEIRQQTSIAGEGRGSRAGRGRDELTHKDV